MKKRLLLLLLLLLKKKRKKKDKNAPKNPKSSYILFSMDMRPKLKEEHPDVDNKQLMVFMGQKWNSASDTVKAKYTKKAAEDKIRYKEELEAYQLKRKEQGIVTEDEKEDVEEPVKKKKKKKIKMLLNIQSHLTFYLVWK